MLEQKVKNRRRTKNEIEDRRINEIQKVRVFNIQCFGQEKGRESIRTTNVV